MRKSGALDSFVLFEHGPMSSEAASIMTQALSQLRSDASIRFLSALAYHLVLSGRAGYPEVAASEDAAPTYLRTINELAIVVTKQLRTLTSDSQ